MSPVRSSAAAGQTVVLLGARGAGKTRLLAGVAARNAGALRALSLHLPPGARVGYCTHRLLLHSRLTARENLQLAASLAGVDGWAHSLQRLLPDAPWWEPSPSTAGMLPRTELRLLALAVALLGDPQLLLVDDLARGLSQPAQRALWRRIEALQQRAPRLILYATSDLRAARQLGQCVWLLQDGEVRARWDAEALPQALRAVQAFALTMKTPREAGQLMDRLRELRPYHCALRADGRTVDVLARGQEPTILELANAAGAGLERFAALPAEVDLLPAGWHAPAEGTGANESPAHAALQVTACATAADSAPRGRRVAVPVARAAWRRYFRAPARRAWPLACHGILLPLLAVLQLQDGAGLVRTALLLQALVAAPGLLLGAREADYWARTAQMETLFTAARAPDARRPPTLLALSDLAGAPLSALLAGMGLGALAILLAHSALFHVLWVTVLWQRGAPAAAIGLGLLLPPGAVALGLLRLLARRLREAD